MYQNTKTKPNPNPRRDILVSPMGYEPFYTFFLYKQPVYKQPVLRPLKNVATFEAHNLPVA